jgi:UDPglucose 6-dehydrogenase
MIINKYKVSIIGLGFVGNAIYESFKINGIDLVVYDKYKNGGIGSLEKCLNSDIMFLALPTLFNQETLTYNKDALHEVCDNLFNYKYQGLIIIKSTLEPNSVHELESLYPDLKFIHNPEFLTARTAFDDFHNQKHIVLGHGNNITNEDINIIVEFYNNLYKDAKISVCSSTESESMKIFLNCFYSVKVQFFTELYLLCKSNGCDFNKIKDMMLKNDWINPMHTTIPGPDGQISYGGLCFPKDTNALYQYMLKMGTPCKVLEACINERDEMRTDHENITFGTKNDETNIDKSNEKC